MTADAELVLFFLFISRRGAPSAENSLSLEVPLFRSRLPLLAASQTITTSKRKFIAPAYRPRGTGRAVLMFSPISLRDLRGDGDCISVHEPSEC